MNKIDIPKDKDELIDFFLEDRKSANDLLEEMTKDVSDKRIDTIKERRVFFQNIATASAAILGLSSVFSSLPGSSILIDYVLYGICLHLAVISVVFLYIREVLDEEMNELVLVLDDLGSVLREKMKLIDSFLLKAVSVKEGALSIKSVLEEYLSSTKGLPAAKILSDYAKKDQRRRDLRVSGKGGMEFYGELINFLFVLGSLFILLAIVRTTPISLQLLILTIIAVFIITFTKILNSVLLKVFGVFTIIRQKYIDLRNQKKDQG